MKGIYVHIPFCLSFCNYCSFYSIKQVGRISEYLNSLYKEIDSKRSFFKESGKYTLYFGGGTPSVLSNVQLKSIVDALNLKDGQELLEFTVEVNPDDVTADYVYSLQEIGVTRVSMGVQSFNDTNLRWMNRRHSAAEALNAYHLLRDGGIKNISIDLIFGYSKELRADIETAIDLAPNHISAYQLSIEHGTPFYKRYSKGEKIVLTQEECADQYMLVQQLFENAGYRQYEISNFALPGYESLHNSSYWNGTPYIGFGPGAHSYEESDVRRWNNQSLSAYVDFYGKGKPVVVCGSEKLSPNDIFNEKIMLGLRQVSGIERSFIAEHKEMLQEVEKLLDNDSLEVAGDNIRIPKNKLFVSDSIIKELFK